MLLLIGAFRGKPSDGPMSELAIGVLGLALIVILLSRQLAGWRRLRQCLHRRHLRRFMKILALVGSIVDAF